MKSSIEFINHASVLVDCGGVTILSDPWYFGSVFHKGWNLIYENEENYILNTLNKTDFIWISHEHPDHFSPSFFKKYSNIIRENKIKILFQKTLDRKVSNFLTSKGFDVKELENNRWFNLSKLAKIFLIKYGDFDSALLFNFNGEKILNLNDCEVKSSYQLIDLFQKTGEVDVLLSQFSYAAWKGGKNNINWRKRAANEKIQTLVEQAKILKVKNLVPFASYMYFSNTENYYLNDSRNSLYKVYKELKKNNIEVIVMKPGDILGGKTQKISIKNAITFWDKNSNQLETNFINDYKSISFSSLKDQFGIYRERIKKNNNILLMKLVRKFSPIKVFMPIVIFIKDLKINIKFDCLNDNFEITKEIPIIEMRSESLYFIFQNSFGFDTITVNGCFEELSRNGFSKMVKTLGIDKLNNIGIKFTPFIFLKFRFLIRGFFSLIDVEKKLNIPF